MTLDSPDKDGALLCIKPPHRRCISWPATSKSSQVYFQHFLVPLLGVEHFWHRYEWQERGSGHIHVFLWLKDAPNPDDIDFNLLKKPDGLISDEQQEKMKLFTDYWDQIIIASSPFPREDYNMPLIGDHPCSIPRENLKKHKTRISRSSQLGRNTYQMHARILSRQTKGSWSSRASSNVPIRLPNAVAAGGWNRAGQ